MNAYTHTTYDGNAVNYRTKAMLQQTADYLGYDSLTVTQGHNIGFGPSGGTHDGWGVVDLSEFNHEEKVKVLRQVGFAAWFRPAIAGLWPNHIHAVAIGDKQMSDAARAQVQDYYAHLNGLASHAWDNQWRPTHIVKFHYPLATVNMQTLLNQAKARGETKESRPSVKIVQRALNHKTGTHLTIDGIYGENTRNAFRRYERQNGGDGDGIPGKLTKKLGLALFKVKEK